MKRIAQGYKEALEIQIEKKHKTFSSLSEKETDLESEKGDDLKDHR
ncbi:hypothetical protein [Algoriphagus ratkowskyi]|nr:hypothetical protein [Algoriphagus ratkowskyi]